MKDIAIGIDLGGTSAKIGLFQTSGERLAHWRIPTRTEENGRYILSDLATSVRKELQKRTLRPDDLDGVGVAVPGMVLPDGSVTRCVNIGWENVQVKKELSALLEEVETIHILNDANAAALGEAWKGAGAGVRSVCMITLGTGVGGGMIIDGKLIEGAFGAAGEIGHLLINPKETALCGCGRAGCLEQYAAAPGIVRAAKAALAETDTPSILRMLQGKIEAKDIFDAAREGDAFALQWVQACAEAIGRAMAMVATVMDPALFLLGGGISNAGEVLLEPVRVCFRKYALAASKNARIEAAALGNDAGMLGAVRTVLPEG